MWLIFECSMFLSNDIFSYISEISIESFNYLALFFCDFIFFFKNKFLVVDFFVCIKGCKDFQNPLGLPARDSHSYLK